MAQRGRPPKITPEIAARFCGYIADGMSRTRAADLIGVHRTTVQAWIRMSRNGKGGKAYSTFASEIAQSEARFIQRNLKSVEKAATPRRSEVVKRTVRNTYDLAGNQTGTSEVIETTTKRELDWTAAKWLLECKDRESFGPDRQEIASLRKELADLSKLLNETLKRRGETELPDPPPPNPPQPEPLPSHTGDGKPTNPEAGGRQPVDSGTAEVPPVGGTG